MAENGGNKIYSETFSLFCIYAPKLLLCVYFHIILPAAHRSNGLRNERFAEESTMPKQKAKQSSEWARGKAHHIETKP